MWVSVVSLVGLCSLVHGHVHRRQAVKGTFSFQPHSVRPPHRQQFGDRQKLNFPQNFPLPPGQSALLFNQPQPDESKKQSRPPSQRQQQILKEPPSVKGPRNDLQQSNQRNQLLGGAHQPDLSLIQPRDPSQNIQQGQQSLGLQSFGFEQKSLANGRRKPFVQGFGAEVEPQPPAFTPPSSMRHKPKHRTDAGGRGMLSKSTNGFQQQQQGVDNSNQENNQQPQAPPLGTAPPAQPQQALPVLQAQQVEPQPQQVIQQQQPAPPPPQQPPSQQQQPQQPPPPPPQQQQQQQQEQHPSAPQEQPQQQVQRAPPSQEQQPPPPQELLSQPEQQQPAAGQEQQPAAPPQEQEQPNAPQQQPNQQQQEAPSQEKLPVPEQPPPQPQEPQQGSSDVSQGQGPASPNAAAPSGQAALPPPPPNGNAPAAEVPPPAPPGPPAPPAPPAPSEAVKRDVPIPDNVQERPLITGELSPSHRRQRILSKVNVTGDQSAADLFINSLKNLSDFHTAEPLASQTEPMARLVNTEMDLAVGNWIINEEVAGEIASTFSIPRGSGPNTMLLTAADVDELEIRGNNPTSAKKLRVQLQELIWRKIDQQYRVTSDLLADLSDALLGLLSANGLVKETFADDIAAYFYRADKKKISLF